MTSDMSKCINCFRCVRACDEVQGQFVLSMAGRGFDSHIVKGIEVSFIESELNNNIKTILPIFPRFAKMA